MSTASEDTQTGTSHPLVLCQYNPEHQHPFCGSAGTSSSFLGHSQTTPASQNHPRVPELPQVPSAAASPPWAQKGQQGALGHSQCQPRMQGSALAVAGDPRDSQGSQPCPHTVMGGHNNYSLPACPACGVLSHMMSHIWDSPVGDGSAISMLNCNFFTPSRSRAYNYCVGFVMLQEFILGKECFFLFFSMPWEMSSSRNVPKS